MFCQNCRNNLPEGAVFCAQCGTKQEAVKEKIRESNAMINTILNLQKKMQRKHYIIAAVSVLILIVAFSLGIKLTKTVNLNDYVTITFEGYDSKGRAKIEFDEEAFAEKYGDRIKVKSTGVEWVDSIITPIDFFLDELDFDLDKKNELSNGDEVTLVWDVDIDNLEDVYGLHVKSKNMTAKVAGLQKIDLFDAFEEVEVIFSGISPAGKAEVVKSQIDNGLTYVFDKEYGIRNGDTITVSISYGWNSEDSYIESYGKLPSAMTKEYAVSGLDEYVGSYSELSEEFLKEVKKEAEDIVLAYAANNYNENVKLSNLEYKGYLFNGINDVSKVSYYYNDLSIIFSGTIESLDGDFDTSTIYYPVQFRNLIDSSNEFSFDENIDILGSFDFNNYWYYSKGYQNPLLCYLENYQSEDTAYNAESGDGFEIYANYEDISSLNDIEASYKQELYDYATKKIEESVPNSFFGTYTLSELTYLGEYLLLEKVPSEDFRSKNKFVILYSGVLTRDGRNSEPTTYYYPVMFEGVVKLPDNTYLVTSYAGIDGYETLPGSWDTTPGYADGTRMYESIITANRDNYTYEISEELKIFGE